ncbi:MULTISPECIES: SCO1664 family protein [Pseudonocardia]|uniref:Phosphatidylinositol 3-and 4-kinase n=2 Tax=Pseudonocardia TaxID=1847 RepID=A0A1Y2MVT2_PSEAH|nr:MULTISPECIES: SCO1664 family protein [Pseudonocardia]OSY39286.1 Phosphatidylinositol 3- and 4-kinase [Pseudonocardia autotrophica]TDN76492.1 putative repeat protein (TIGR03843 family) [Pseudonocardia autotrophica]BBG00492.1 phosphatidylinositol kinase [Pseudonocardia autotrophica]GEC26452.1 phosphatidylinositol kinase [Pseudonocardia saturnea]
MSGRAPDLRDPAVIEVLTRGRIEITGRLVDASNATLFGTAALDGIELRCVYKPVRGERPLWDFPDGTLAGREVGAYLVAEESGLRVVPPTVLREEAPFGPGMVQAWVSSGDESALTGGADADEPGSGFGAEIDEETIQLAAESLVELCEPDDVRDGWLPVLRARDGAGDPIVLVHADHPQLRAMALFDVVVNNADRKGGHVILGGDGGVYGVDHGLTLHSEPKLRTVLWGWIGDELGEEHTAALKELRAKLAGDFADTLGEHVTRREVAALRSRIDHLLAEPRFPGPDGFGPAIPWPAF